jgi:Bacterial pre-peptidase C-terminal domain
VPHQSPRSALRAKLVTVVSALAAIAALLAPSSLAATENGDAGDLPATAQDLGAAPDLGSISGTLASGSDRDMYRICLSGGGSFSATTVGGSAVDTELFLFDGTGHGVYADDDSQATRQSTLPANDPLTPTAAGSYFLAVSPFDQDPVGPSGRIFPNQASLTGPNPAGGGLEPISGWTGRAGGNGAYTISLTGVVPCEVPDTTDPTVDLRVPADGATFGRGDQVLADFDCADEQDGSGLASCVGTVDDGQPIDTATLGQKSFSVTATDAAGNDTTVTHTYNVVDRTAPTITISSPEEGANYAIGEEVLADYECADEAGGSGVATCVGDVADGDPVNTSTAGVKAFVVRATDNAGNESVEVVHYTVGFDFTGFLGLANPPGVNEVKAGRVVPVKFSIDGFHGFDVFADGYPQSADYDCDAEEEPELDGGKPTSRVGRVIFNPRRDRYVYPWRTDPRWAGTCRQLVVKLSDGSVHRANFEFEPKHRRHHGHWRWWWAWWVDDHADDD